MSDNVLNCFNSRLYKQWSNHDNIHDFGAEIQEMGSESGVTVKNIFKYFISVKSNRNCMFESLRPCSTPRICPRLFIGQCAMCRYAVSKKQVGQLQVQDLHSICLSPRGITALALTSSELIRINGCLRKAFLT